MKKLFKTKWILFVCAGLFLESCTKNFDQINTNPNAASTAPATNIFASGIVSAANTLYGTRLDIYYAGSYAGMTASISQGDYEYRVDINSSIWNDLYTAANIFVSTMNTAAKDSNTNLQAAALTMKVYTAQKVTDMFGDVPYSEAFSAAKNIIYPKFDKQKDVYTAMFAELKTAADMFKTGKGNLGAGDFIYQGDVAKWREFCNSLRLRLAIRISNVDPATAKSVMTDVLGNPADYPVMTTNDGNAYFYYPGVAPNQELWFEDAGVGNRTLGNYRLNNVLISSMAVNSDPRLSVYALPNKWGKYHGYSFFLGQSSDTLNNGNNVSTIGDRFANDPKGFSPFMNCAEVYFILAEAYEKGLATGDAEAAYKMGIAKSMEENGIDATATATFLALPGVSYNTGSSTHLEKIGTQKYISLFKQSVEAWSEARRTDIPLMLGVSDNYANKHNRPPFRLSYADQERTLNGSSFPVDVKIVDIFWGDQMWWDTRTNVH